MLQVAQEIESEARFQNGFINQLVCHEFVLRFFQCTPNLLFPFHRCYHANLLECFAALCYSYGFDGALTDTSLPDLHEYIN
ncbi:hypothetical protein RDI58_011589 [Solanum bulbocastanum]|uniref:Uncharacterized protein n=1 Tax=Solanum bulbocastanum TaxID=147425 RepID=A0AAN8YKL8_SOLBU